MPANDFISRSGDQVLGQLVQLVRSGIITCVARQGNALNNYFEFIRGVIESRNILTVIKRCTLAARVSTTQKDHFSNGETHLVAGEEERSHYLQTLFVIVYCTAVSFITVKDNGNSNRSIEPLHCCCRWYSWLAIHVDHPCRKEQPGKQFLVVAIADPIPNSLHESMFPNKPYLGRAQTWIDLVPRRWACRERIASCLLRRKW